MRNREQSLSLDGHLTCDDLKQYHVELREPLYWRHRGATVALNPPPAAMASVKPAKKANRQCKINSIKNVVL